MNTSHDQPTGQHRSTGAELVSVGVFTVVLAVINVACNMIGVLGPEVQPFGAVVAMVVNGVPFALFVHRIHRFGPVTIMATLLGLVSAVAGDSLVGVPFALLFGLLGDLVLRSGGYRDPARTILGYGLFGIYPVGNILPLLFMRDALLERYTAQSTAEWAERFGAFLSPPMIGVMVVVFFLASLAGGWLGQRALRGYFRRAGL